MIVKKLIKYKQKYRITLILWVFINKVIEEICPGTSKGISNQFPNEFWRNCGKIFQRNSQGICWKLQENYRRNVQVFSHFLVEFSLFYTILGRIIYKTCWCVVVVAFPVQLRSPLTLQNAVVKSTTLAKMRVSVSRSESIDHLHNKLWLLKKFSNQLSKAFSNKCRRDSQMNRYIDYKYIVKEISKRNTKRISKIICKEITE